MDLANICTNSGVLTVFLILKYAFSIICTIIPIIVIINAIKTLYPAVITGDKINEKFTSIVKSVIAGIIVFLLPTIIPFVLETLVNFNESDVGKCFTNATVEKIKQFKEIEAQELEDEQKQKLKDLVDATKKRKEEEEEKNSHLQPNTRPNENNQGLTSSGTGIWKGSVFPLPSGATSCRSSIFGPRTHPITGQYDNHSGDDYPAACGTSVYAVLDGKVIEAANDGGYHYGMGNYVKIRHSDGTYSVYMHSSNVIVSVGQDVKKGQEIMKVGTTGSSTGCHLHITIENSSGVYVEPSNYIPTLPSCN